MFIGKKFSFGNKIMMRGSIVRELRKGRNRESKQKRKNKQTNY